ncbi:MAG: lipase maturation factor family protein [Candidatus Binatia bacterium]|nr:lipase maturation factor family protein [Candidatus Binatia bacterium]
MLQRSLFLRALGLTYLIAFLSLEWQIAGLLGAEGLRPAAEFLSRAREALAGADLTRIPTLFWLASGDSILLGACWVGAALSLLIVSGTLPLPSLVGCWLLYLSLVNVGAPFLNYQWDALLLETGFLAIFWAPMTLRLASPLATTPSPLVRWLLVWLLFRLMFFSGWVKLASGDSAWWDLTALQYHYETQPLPTWASWYVNQLPAWFHKLSVAGTFVIELIVPFFIVLGRRGRAVAAATFLGLQAFIGATGNYGFFNLLTAVLCIPLLDDSQLRAVIPPRYRERIVTSGLLPSRGRAILHTAVASILLLLTVPGAVAQVSGLRTTFADPLARVVRPFHLTSRYGLFAVMTKTRPEVVLEGSDDGTTWTPYVFLWKPGAVDRAPAFVGPGMPRLDWQMWFDGLYFQRALEAGGRVTNVVTPSLLARLQEGSPAVLDLLGPDPFGESPPRHVRWKLYDYQFTNPSERDASADWWKRRLLYGD